MATLGEFLSPEAGQERRKWLNETLGYYLPPELRGIVGLGAELNPVTNMERAGTAAQRVADPSLGGWDRMAAAGDMAVNMGAVLAPVGGAKLAGTAGVDGANAIVEALTAASPMKGAVDDFLVDEFGGVPLMGGGMSDPTQTGWTFRDVDNNIGLSRAENKMLSEGALQPTQEVVPIRSLYAMQPRVNPDFATTTSSEGTLPNVIRKNGKLFLQDGHHRATRVAEEGSQNLRVNFYDFDRADRSAPLLDYDAGKAAKQRAEDDEILRLLFGDLEAQ